MGSRGAPRRVSPPAARRSIGAGMFLAVLLASGPAHGQDILPLLEPDEQTKILGTNELSPPVWMAVIANREETRFLASRGEPLFREGEPRPIGVIRNVGPEGLSVTLTEGGRTVRVAPGRPVTGAGNPVYRQAVLIKALEYRHRPVERGGRKILNGELYLVALRGGRAVLQRDIDAPPSPLQIMQDRLAAIRIVEAGPQTWEVSAKDVQTAMESGEAIVTDALQKSRIDLSREHGVGLVVKTPMVEARLDTRGFVITDPLLASRAGLLVGDRILQVNDVPIDGIGSLLRAYRAVKDNPTIRTVDVLIERNERPLSLAYRVR